MLLSASLCGSEYLGQGARPWCYSSALDIEVPTPVE